MKETRELTFSSKWTTAGAKAHADAFGDLSPEDLPWQLEWPFPVPPPDKCSRNCNEYGELLMSCVKRGKPVTVREYVDFFWKGEDGIYRAGISKEIATADYDDFIRLASAEEVLV